MGILSKPLTSIFFERYKWIISLHTPLIPAATRYRSRIYGTMVSGVLHTKCGIFDPLSYERQPCHATSHKCVFWFRIFQGLCIGISCLPYALPLWLEEVLGSEEPMDLYADAPDVRAHTAWDGLWGSNHAEALQNDGSDWYLQRHKGYQADATCGRACHRCNDFKALYKEPASTPKHGSADCFGVRSGKLVMKLINKKPQKHCGAGAPSDESRAKTDNFICVSYR